MDVRFGVGGCSGNDHHRRRKRTSRTVIGAVISVSLAAAAAFLILLSASSGDDNRGYALEDSSSYFEDIDGGRRLARGGGAGGRNANQRRRQQKQQQQQQQGLRSASSNEPATDDHVRYGIVIDAGSSGSRIVVFSWNDDDYSSPMVQLAPSPEVGSESDESFYSTTPGLSHYARYDGAAGAGESLDGLIDAARAVIPEGSWSSTDLFVLATAGLRMLDPARSEMVLDQTFAYLTASTDNCPFHVAEVDVISGRDEGLYAFLSINHGLDADGDLARWRGLLDLGGASTQVTYKPDPARNLFLGHDDSHVPEDENGLAFRLREEPYSVFATSYLNFGLDVAMRRYVENLAEDRPDGATVSSPCHNPGPVAGEYVTSDGRTIHLRGTGNGALCLSRASELLYRNYECDRYGCPMAMSDLRGDFYALSAFFYVAYDLGLVEWSGSVELKPSDLADAGYLYCGGRLDGEGHEHDAVEVATCFNANYAAAILDSYGFEEYDGGRITFARKMPDGRNADWSLGSLIYRREMRELGNGGRGGATRATARRKGRRRDLLEAHPDSESAKARERSGFLSPFF